MHVANYSEGTLRMIRVDDAQKADEAIARSAFYPQKEVLVGCKAKSAYFGHRVLSDFNERLSGYVPDKLELDVTPLTSAKQENLHKPISQGDTVAGGVRRRLAEKDAALQQAREKRP